MQASCKWQRASWYMIWGRLVGRTKPERKFYPVGADGTAQYEVDMGKYADSTLGKVTCRVRLSSPCVCLWMKCERR